MQITDVRIKLTESNNPSQERLLGFASITLDGGFVVQDIKIISGPNGIFVAMPSRKVAAHCPTCHVKNNLGSNFCNECGGKLPPIDMSPDKRPKLFADIAHPINAETRKMVEGEILKAFNAAVAAGGAMPAGEPRPGRTVRRFGAAD